MAIDDKEIENLEKRIRGLSSEITKEARAKKASREQEARIARDKIREARQEINNLKKSNPLRKKLTDELEDQIDNYEDLKKSQEKLDEVTKKVGQSFIGLGKAAFEGSGSISAFTDNVKGLGILGNRLDVNIETFRQLSQSGANFGKSIVDLRMAAHDAALPLDDFAKLVAENSQNLAAIAGSSSQGAKFIAQLGQQTRDLGVKQLAPLGFTVDEINETLLLNLDSQRRTGVLDRLTSDQQRDSAISFALELDRLAKLTGQQRDELRAAIENQKSNERFQAALQGQTEETRKRLQGFAATVEGISPELATGFQDLIANAGVPVTDAALEIAQNVPQAGAVIKQLIAGTLSSEQALVKFRDLSANSLERFNKVAVTGQVDFLRLTGGFIELGRRVNDLGEVEAEQEKQASKLVGSLTTFEQATKVLASQFQSIETGLLQAFGPALGTFFDGVQGAFGKGGSIATVLAKSPGVTAGLLLAGLGGKYLLDFGQQVAAITAGTFAGFKMANPTGGGAGGFFGKGGAGRTGLGIAGRGVGILGGVGLAAGGAAQAGTAETAGGKAMGVLSSMAGGAMIGSMIPGVGTLIGGGLGLGAGLLGLAMNKNGRQFGGGMDAGKTYLTGEAGPEMITAGTKSTVTANNDLKTIFDTQALESKMNTMVTALNNTNQSLASVANGVNTLVAVESRALKAVETTARKDRNQVGIV